MGFSGTFEAGMLGLLARVLSEQSFGEGGCIVEAKSPVFDFLA